MENQYKKPYHVVSLNQISQYMESYSLQDEVVVFQTSFEGADNRIFPLYIDALMIILVREGSGKIGIDLTEHEFGKDSLMVLQPKNYIFLHQSSEGCRANVIACSRHIIEDVLPKLTDILPLLLHHRAEPVSRLTAEEAERLNDYFEFITSRLRNPSGMFVKQKVLRLLQSALYEMMDIQSESYTATERPRSRQEEIMAKFIIEVTDNFRQERHVSFYADRLCITPKHLSAVVKKISGRTAGEWIDNYVVMEAKVLLKTTDNTIQEVSDMLNFKNQSFFGKFFKHLTGFTPTAYRKANNS
ncbi:MAG: helix-turn-helix domain-containing protein [Clostridium sp.]|nr:helix-turn-helix domain-containing protein [Prevotella sp.]MCM1429561.1 helix-turn-helix domain-containing protein [Clostridium sp.]MCM1476032.1 helix-turn-helix domain-containing protein [Muribaculaceae bacterium]